MTKASHAFREELSDLTGEKGATLSDLSGHTREIAGRLSPQTSSDVVRIVRAARNHGIKLHAFSCGKNWGFGSTLPSNNGAWLVDLSRMTNIHSYEAESGSICIEPGVTQLMLFQALAEKGNEWFFNVTGAGEATSVLGNALERGIGYYGQRHLDLIELEVVTGTGDIIWTRLGHDVLSANGAALGPDITQLFPQTGLGIVTSARLRLLKRMSGNGTIIARLRDNERAPEFFRRVLALKREGCIAGVPHVGNRERIVSTMIPWLQPGQERPFLNHVSAWTAALPMLGCREMTLTAAGIIEGSLAEFGEIEVILGESDLSIGSSALEPMNQLKQLASGFPSNLALPGVQWSALGKADVTALDPEKTEAGLIHITPAISSSASEIERVVTLLENTADDLDLKPLPITVNMVDSLTTVMVVSLPFVKSEAATAQKKARSIWRALSQAGLRPYRLGLIHDEEWLAPAASASLFRDIRAALDPSGVFAPSKYEALFPKRSRVVSHKRDDREISLVPTLQEAA